jgi:hypothetical protein
LETGYKGKKRSQLQDREAGHRQALGKRYCKRPEGIALTFLDTNSEWCDKDQLKTISICDDILGNQNWGQKPSLDCRHQLMAIVNHIRREQEWHDAQAGRHARLLRQHEERTGGPIFCGPLSAHWNGRSKSAGKRPRASEGVFAERCVVKERVTVSERMCHMR